ncbi:synaptobrevin-like [Teleopsis dalmanni]|uniref:synaptobrevin-like n=1 Tax=Teleopsis dalmanni TaxID=139649 RepID=UPI0018CE38BE|nr:synaptobrevin-like [Teleopsis dalmanni]
MGKKDKNKGEADPAPASDAPPADGAPAGEGGDGEIVGGPRNPQQIAAQKRLQQTQAQVDELLIEYTTLFVVCVQAKENVYDFCLN